jgi:PAS domain S-box-containing protein
MDQKKPYTRPRLVEYRHGSPEWVRELLRDNRVVSAQHSVKASYSTLVDADRKYVRVSDSFCELVGYKADELIGKRFDDFTAPNTADPLTVFKLFTKLGYMHGLWVLVHRTGSHILVRYDAWLRADFYIEANMELVKSLS